MKTKLTVKTLEITRRNFLKSAVAALVASQTPISAIVDQLSQSKEEADFIARIAQEIIDTLMYGDVQGTPETFKGLAGRVSQPLVTQRKNNNPLTSIWVCEWK